MMHPVLTPDQTTFLTCFATAFFFEPWVKLALKLTKGKERWLKLYPANHKYWSWLERLTKDPLPGPTPELGFSSVSQTYCPHYARRLLRIAHFLHYRPADPVLAKRKGRDVAIPTRPLDDYLQIILSQMLLHTYRNYISTWSYGITGGPARAAQRASRMLQARPGCWLLRLDIEGFFGSITVDRLDTRLHRLRVDPITRTLCRRYTTGALRAAHWYAPEAKGTLAGQTLGPVLSELYLIGFDRFLTCVLGIEYVRYVDDLLILCESEAHAKEMLRGIQTYLRQMKLVLQPSKLQIVQPGESFRFLGYVYGSRDRKLYMPEHRRKASQDKLRELKYNDIAGAKEALPASYWSITEDYGDLLVEAMTTAYPIVTITDN